MAAPKKSIPYQVNHEQIYGVKVCSLDPKTKEVTSVAGKFCIIFGHEKRS